MVTGWGSPADGYDADEYNNGPRPDGGAADFYPPVLPAAADHETLGRLRSVVMWSVLLSTAIWVALILFFKTLR